MSSIDFIYFDLGKVILDFEHEIGCRNVAEVAGITPETVREVLFDTGLEVKYETGLLSCDEFHQAFCTATNSRPSKDELLVGMSDIFSPNRAIFPLISQLRAVNFPIGILSNTCTAHWEFVYAKYTILREYFSPLMLSYQVKSMKPDSKIYERALEAAGCELGKCFFVDDRPENVNAANAAGMDAVLYRTVPDLIEQLVQRGVAINL